MKNRVIDTFRKLGFDLKPFEENIYVFTYEGVNLVYKYYTDDDNFLQIGLPLHKSEKITDIYKLANELNLRLKYVKACIYKENLWILYERELSTDVDLDSLIKNVVVCMVNSMHFYMDLLNYRENMSAVDN